MSQPLVSVVIPTFNSGGLLPLTLESVLAQTWRRTEVIVVDDGSTDDTQERLRPYLARVRSLRQAQAGAGAARNAGVRAARGQHVAFLDHDDLWAPDTVARQLEVAQRHPESGLVACDGTQLEGPRREPPALLTGPLAQRMHAAGGLWTGDAHGALLHANAISTPGQVLLPRAVLEQVGPLTEHEDEPSDYDLWLRVAQRRPITLHSARLVGWRYRPEGRSGLAALRPLRWALMDLPVLQRHLERVGPEGRSEVRAGLRRRALEARLAWLLGRLHGMREARVVLCRLARVAPWTLRPRLWWLATWLPPRLVLRWAVRGSSPEDLATLGQIGGACSPR